MIDSDDRTYSLRLLTSYTTLHVYLVVRRGAGLTSFRTLFVSSMASTSAISTTHHNATVHVTNLFLVDSGAMQSNIIPYYAMTLRHPKK